MKPYKLIKSNVTGDYLLFLHKDWLDRFEDNKYCSFEVFEENLYDLWGSVGTASGIVPGFDLDLYHYKIYPGDEPLNVIYLRQFLDFISNFNSAYDGEETSSNDFMEMF